VQEIRFAYGNKFCLKARNFSLKKSGENDYIAAELLHCY